MASNMQMTRANSARRLSLQKNTAFGMRSTSLELEWAWTQHRRHSRRLFEKRWYIMLPSDPPVVVRDAIVLVTLALVRCLPIQPASLLSC